MSKNRSLLAWGLGLGAGAGAMYLLDPLAGKRRRAVLQDKLNSALCHAADGAGVVWRDMANRSKGLIAESLNTLMPDEADDAVLVERVRTKLGRLCSHPDAIDVFCRDGKIELSGQILKPELQCVLDGVAGVRGVKGVENNLEPHRSAEGVSSLQGGRQRAQVPELLQDNQAPAIRLLEGLAGAAMMYYGMGRNGIVGRAAQAIGSGMLIRSLTNLESKRLTGIGAGRRAVDIHKTIYVKAPLDQVWSLWSKMENFPRFMSHVKEVHKSGDGRYHWSVTGPAGTRFEWDAAITNTIDRQLISWKTTGRPSVAHSGTVRFEEAPGEGTRIDIRMCYNPPAGAIGHSIAKLLGFDAKKQLDDDMVRLKGLLEHGKVNGEEILAELREAEEQGEARTHH